MKTPDFLQEYALFLQTQLYFVVVVVSIIHPNTKTFVPTKISEIIYWMLDAILAERDRVGMDGWW